MSEATELTEVTAEQWETILPDIEKVLGLKRKKNEALIDYATRLAKTAVDPKKLTDDAWQTLDDLTQEWVNGSQHAMERGESVLLPPDTVEDDGVVDDASDDVDADDADQPDSEEDVAQELEEPAKAPTKKKPAKKTPAAPAPAPAKTKAKPKAAPKSSDASTTRGRPTLFGPDAKITPAHKENPYREGSKGAAWYAKYKKGQTVDEAIAAGVPRGQIRFDVNKGNISVK